jgi:hypothetical protein
MGEPFPPSIPDQLRRTREIDESGIESGPQLESQEHAEEVAENQGPEYDPIELVPILRHNLLEALWAMNMALSYIQACDLADSYRSGLTMPQESHLAKRLDRSYTTLADYLGLLDDKEVENESVPEDE